MIINCEPSEARARSEVRAWPDRKASSVTGPSSRTSVRLPFHQKGINFVYVSIYGTRCGAELDAATPPCSAPHWDGNLRNPFTYCTSITGRPHPSPLTSFSNDSCKLLITNIIYSRFKENCKQLLFNCIGK